MYVELTLSYLHLLLLLLSCSSIIDGFISCFAMGSCQSCFSMQGSPIRFANSVYFNTL